ncbi:hypothetical protein D9613_004242 [Agrocybe pediades]|uniref:Uncharacterized protein n=1 Tax=Agrocybe pediades TaxID=84607 RepID=A0A8H4QJ96_9AGAR|nr:hypothetical protein D9613_004242 [Agrocybe pediades]
MDSGPTLKPKVAGKLNYGSSPARPPSTNTPSRPSSPTKSYVSTNGTDSTFRPRAKVNSSATTRRTVASSSNSSTVGGSASTTPRAGSPAKQNPRIKSPVTVTSTNGVNRTTLKSPTNNGASAPVTPEIRKTATASSSLRVAGEDYSRSRTGSVSLHHAVSFSSFKASSSSSSVVSSSPRMETGMGSKPGTVSASASPRLVASKSIMHLNTNNADRSQTSSPTLKIRAKVSNLAKAASADASAPPSPTSPPALSPTARSTVSVSRTRAQSSSTSVLGLSNTSNVDSSLRSTVSPPPQFYPITTAVPAANPHRFPSSRPTAASTITTSSTQQRPATAHHIFQSFSQSSSSSLDPTPNYAQPITKAASTSPRPQSSSGRPSLNGIAKVDPASIPLPPHSPPISSVSFSSRSSFSQSSAGNQPYAASSASSTTDSAVGTADPSLQHNYHGQPPKSNGGSAINGDEGSMRDVLDNLLQYTSGLKSPTDDDDDGESGVGRDGEDHKVKAEAKSNRKIADLEITNRSLLVINASLEATKHRQAREIRELRRKLRESRLILPPRAFRAVKSSLEPDELGDDEEDVDGDDGEEEWFDADDGSEGTGDEIYKRIKLMLESMLKTGQAALDKKTEDFGGGAKAPAKVLSPEEVKDWRGGADDQDEHGHDEHNASMDSSGFLLDSETGTDADRNEDVLLSQQLLRPHGGEDDSLPSGLRRISEGSSYYTSEEGGEDEDSFFENNINNDTMTSEDEVEAMTISGLSPPASPSPKIHPPPILITKPTL